MMKAPELTSNLRKDFIQTPECISEHASGIRIFGKLIKSLIFTTDVAIIANSNADAIIAVYPFSPQLSITKAITEIANVPVLCGVGGGLTNGLRSANIALHAEFQGVSAVVLNGPAPDETIAAVAEMVDIPVVATVVSEFADIEGKLAAGASVLNVSGGPKTACIVREIRKKYPELPIIATGGPTEEMIMETIAAGANAISFTPISNGDLFKKKMAHYRLEEEELANK